MDPGVEGFERTSPHLFSLFLLFLVYSMIDPSHLSSVIDRCILSKL